MKIIPSHNKVTQPFFIQFQRNWDANIALKVDNSIHAKGFDIIYKATVFY